jgi:septum formation inhibitor-activating ATPase MinD
VAARAAIHYGSATLVDLDLTGGGIEVTVGIEHVPGLRWDGLTAVEGGLEPEQLRAALPQLADVAVLSAGRGEGVPATAVSDVLHALCSGRHPVVVDLPRTSPQATKALAWAELVVPVVGLRVRQLADADLLVTRLMARWPSRGAAGDGRPQSGVAFMTRGRAPREDVLEAIEEHLDVAQLGHWPDDGAVVRASERGDWPGTRGTTRGVAEDILVALARRREAAA